ncbi:hypothetical protein KKH13_03310 [Patescibacteria group bacterium]|nr:hypothetical protein [Patescibacteria group bacterium]
MILSLLAFIVSAVALFLSSQALLSRLFRLFPLNLVFFLLLPGIFLHEFSHILMAEILQVKTGELKLWPELKDGHLNLGSAQIASTDPLRLTLIGVAPFLAGTATLWGLIQFGLVDSLGWWRLLTGFLIFAVANTLFSSASDLQAAAIPVILTLIVFGLFSLTNLNLPTSLIEFFPGFFFNLARMLGYTLVVNLALLLPLKFLHHIS